MLVLVALAAVAAAGFLLSARTAARPDTVRLAGAGGRYAVTVTLDQAATGAVGAEVRVEGQAPDAAPPDAVWLSAAMPSMGHATPEVPARRRSPGRFTARGELFAMPGEWELAVRVQGTSGAEVITVPVPIPVKPQEAT